jgi:hypothetical protein
MPRPPRSPRTIKMLDSLQEIYVNPDASASERIAAATLANKIMNRRAAKKQYRKRTLRTSSAGADLRPATVDPLQYFRDKLK